MRVRVRVDRSSVTRQLFRIYIAFASRASRKEPLEHAFEALRCGCVRIQRRFLLLSPRAPSACVGLPRVRCSSAAPVPLQALFHALLHLPVALVRVQGVPRLGLAPVLVFPTLISQQIIALLCLCQKEASLPLITLNQERIE